MPSDVHIVCGCSQATMAKLNSCDKDRTATKPKVFTVWPSTEKVCRPWSTG